LQDFYCQHAPEVKRQKPALLMRLPQLPPMQEIETANQWNAFDISARGGHIIVELNGTIVIDFRDQAFSNGPIGEI
jgi:hypothetical protein